MNIGGYFLTRYGGHAMPIIAQVTFLCEISMIHYNIRTLLGKDAPGLLALLNSIMFFVTYTIFRMIMWPFFMYALYKSKDQYNFSAET